MRQREKLTIVNKSESDVTRCTEEEANGQSGFPSDPVKHQHRSEESRDLDGTSENEVQVHGIREAGRVNGEAVVHEGSGDPPDGRRTHAAK